MLAQPGKYKWTIHVRQHCSLISTYFDHLLLQLSISTSKQQINVNECLTDTQGKQNNWPDSNEVSAMDGMIVVLNDHHTMAQQHVCLPASILLCCQTSHQMSTSFYVITNITKHYRLKMFYQTQIARRSLKGPKNAVCCPWWPWPLTFKLIGVTCLLCEFGANPFSSSRDISYTNKRVTQTAPKREPYAVQCVR